MPFESLHSELCGKTYGRFAKTAQDRPKLCTVVFWLNFRVVLWELSFVLWMKVLQDFLIFSYWGFIAQLEVGGEGFEFSKVGFQMVI